MIDFGGQQVQWAFRWIFNLPRSPAVALPAISLVAGGKNNTERTWVCPCLSLEAADCARPSRQPLLACCPTVAGLKVPGDYRNIYSVARERGAIQLAGVGGASPAGQTLFDQMITLRLKELRAATRPSTRPSASWLAGPTESRRTAAAGRSCLLAVGGRAQVAQGQTPELFPARTRANGGGAPDQQPRRAVGQPRQTHYARRQALASRSRCAGPVTPCSTCTAHGL